MCHHASAQCSVCVQRLPLKRRRAGTSASERRHALKWAHALVTLHPVGQSAASGAAGESSICRELGLSNRPAVRCTPAGGRAAHAPVGCVAASETAHSGPGWSEISSTVTLKRLIVVSGWLESVWTLLRLCLVRGQGGDRSPLSKTLGTPKFSTVNASTCPRARKVRLRALGCLSVLARLARSLLW